MKTLGNEWNPEEARRPTKKLAGARRNSWKRVEARGDLRLRVATYGARENILSDVDAHGSPLIREEKREKVRRRAKTEGS